MFVHSQCVDQQSGNWLQDGTAVLRVLAEAPVEAAPVAMHTGTALKMSKFVKDGFLMLFEHVDTFLCFRTFIFHILVFGRLNGSFRSVMQVYSGPGSQHASFDSSTLLCICICLRCSWGLTPHFSSLLQCWCPILPFPPLPLQWWSEAPSLWHAQTKPLLCRTVCSISWYCINLTQSRCVFKDFNSIIRST